MILKVGDQVVRRWNGHKYYIIGDVDKGQEFLIHRDKDAKFKDCKVCEMRCNLTVVVGDDHVD